MKALQGFLAVCFSCVLLGGLYIGSVVLGYFFAFVGIVLSVLVIGLGVLVMVAYTVYEAFNHCFKNKTHK